MESIVHIKGQELHLLPEKALYWEDQQMLIIADVHFGKTGHFRKNGIAMLSEMPMAELENLARVVDRIQPKTLVFLGDLFHSELNYEWGILQDWLAHLQPDVILVNGNHDQHLLQNADLRHIETLPELKIGPFHLTHEPEKEPSELYNLAGHIHPGIRLRGKGRQSMRLPAFCFGENQGLLPAFGLTTGLAIQKLNKKSQYFIAAGSEVSQVKQ